MIHKRIKSVICLLAILVAVTSCDNNSYRSNAEVSSVVDAIFSGSSSTGVPQRVIDAFIEENRFMTEKDALSKEVNYYREPRIIRSSVICELTGRDLIHIANEITREDNEKEMIQFGPTSFKIIRNVQDIKDVGMDNPDKNVGTLYVLGGDFVHYNNGAQRNWKLAIYVPKIKRYLEVEYKHLTSQSQSCINTESNSWMMNLPVFENVELW